MNVIWVIIFLWLVGLTLVTIRLWHHYNRLTAGLTKKGLLDILDKLLNERVEVNQKLGKIEEKISQIVNHDQNHIQRIGVVRFNPFADTGGSQSFTVAILDDLDNGIIMTNLYARSGNRLYLKEVINSKGKGLELSKEEEAAIVRAKTKLIG